MNFPDRKNTTCLTVYHHKGGELHEGMKIYLERNLQTPLIEANLVSWQIGEVSYDVTGYGKYSKSNCIVEFDNKQYSWPFSMIYVL